MLPFEILSCIFLSIALIRYWIPEKNRPSKLVFISIFAALILFCHFIFEYPRWQMVPVYFLEMVLLIADLPGLMQAGGFQAESVVRLSAFCKNVAIGLGLLLIGLVFYLGTVYS